VRICFISERFLKTATRLSIYFDDILKIKNRVSVGHLPNAIEIFDSTSHYLSCFILEMQCFKNYTVFGERQNIDSYFAQETSLKETQTTEPPTDSCHHSTPDSHIILADELFQDVRIKEIWGLLYADHDSYLVTVDDSSRKPSFLEWFLTKRRKVTNFEKSSWQTHDLKKELDTLQFDDAAPGYSRVLAFDMHIGLQVASSKQTIKCYFVTNVYLY